MKKLMIFVASIVLCACDANKGKVEELANRFIAAYNDGDKAAVYDLLPAAKTRENLVISGSIGQADGINVERDDSTGNYIATINELKQQRLVFAVDSVGGIQMIDAYGVFHLDSVSNEIALKTGVPVKKLSDIEVGKLMDVEGNFISDLKMNKQPNFLWTNNGGYSWFRTSSNFNVTMSFSVTNSSSQMVSGKDYYIVVSPSVRSTGRAFSAKTLDGVDIAPNEVREFNVNEPSLYNYASERDLSYTIDIKYRSESILSFLLTYGTFDGSEYADYMEHPHRVKLKAVGRYGVVNSEKNGIAYVYKEMSDKSKVVDTLYHRKCIHLIWESESWASIYEPYENGGLFDYNDQFIGYMKAKDIDNSGNVPELDLVEMHLKSDNGKINVYDASNKVIKTLPTGQNVLLELGEDGDAFLYERQHDGSVKKIGRINRMEVDFGYDD